jgi:hypothetical protein
VLQATREKKGMTTRGLGEASEGGPELPHEARGRAQQESIAGCTPAPRQGPRRAGDGPPVVTMRAPSHRLWVWAVAAALIGLSGCSQEPVGPAPEPPPGCVDQFSGRVSRECL